MSSDDPVASRGEETTLVLSGIGTELSDRMLMNMYRTYGPIVRVRHNGTNSAQVIFAQKPHALKAMKATNGAVVYGKTLKVSLQRPFKKTTEPCRGFVAGICRKGDMCKYYHVTDDAAFATQVPPVRTKAPCESKIRASKSMERIAIPPEIQAIPDKKVCRHFSRGYCSQGEQCKFAHVLGLPNQAVPAPTGKVAQPCLFFQSGVCARGDACRYVHEPTAGAAASAQASTPQAVAQSSNSDNESDAEAEPDGSRTCVECEKPGEAVWKCAKCDNSLYCDDCNATVHRARVMAKHKRIKLPSLPKLPRCGECESKTANVRCEQCEVPFCASCDASVHQFKSLRKHVRVKLSANISKTQPNAKEATQEHMAAKKKESHIVESMPQVIDPVLYVESVPQLEFSSDSASESEDEEVMKEVLPIQGSNGDEPMAAAASSESESDEDFDDVKPPHLSSVTTASVVKAQASHSSGSESEDDVDDMPAAKSSLVSTSVPKMELSSDSDSCDSESFEPTRDPSSTSKEALSSDSEDDFEDAAPLKSAVQPTPARKSVLVAISSKSESGDNNEAPPIHAVKQQKAKMSPGSSNGSKHEAPSKPAAKKKASSSESSESSSIESSDSSEVEAPQLKSITPAPLRAPVQVRNKTAGGISAGSSHTLVKKIEAYNKSNEDGDLHLDANLNGFERLLAHDCAERLGLGHESIGMGLDRHIIISRHDTKRPATDSGKGLKSKKSKRRRL
ncbi:hypothetical protein DD237_001447 [Peronospora effusa]|uniref:RING-type E3 ubiquitin transferase n=1 Tax=Peronospora effusa TaxID=542832 RepID=A0A425CK67_9STRA|nr:hypothetical protein DD237_001447 [Peronospora effusa]